MNLRSSEMEHKAHFAEQNMAWSYVARQTREKKWANFFKISLLKKDKSIKTIHQSALNQYFSR